MKFKDMLLEKTKKGEMLDDSESEIMGGVLGEMTKPEDDKMIGKLKGMQKVTVAAPDKEGLEQGLEKAEDIVEGETSEIEDEVSPIPMVDEDETEIDPVAKLAELESQIAELKAMLAK